MDRPVHPVGCAGVGSVPALLNFFTAAFASDQLRAFLFSEFSFLNEASLWCNVTIIATVVIFISKYNIVSELSKNTGVDRLPTSWVFVSYVILPPNAIVYVFLHIGVLSTSQATPWVLGCVVGTLLVSVAFERAVSKAVYTAANWRK